MILTSRRLGAPLICFLALTLAAAAQQGPPPEAPRTDIMSAAEADPDAPRGVVAREPGTYDGYTLYAPLNSRMTYLIDMDGEVVHTWEADSANGTVYLLDDGSLLRCGREDESPRFRGGGIGGRIQRLAPDGKIAWQWKLAGERRHQHHDIEPLPNGNLLVIAWERIPAEDAVARGRDPAQVGEAGLWPDVLLEIRPTPPEGAEVVWEWRVWDHIVQDLDPKLPGYASIPERPELVDVNGDHRDQPPETEQARREREAIEAQLRSLGYVGGDEDGDDGEGEGNRRGRRERGGDWLHTNSIDYLPEHDLIVLSTPRFDELWVIDHSTTTAEAASHQGGRWGRGGDLLWRWGNPRTYGAGTDADRRLFGQHDATWLSGGEGELRLLVLNNGRGRPDGDYSSVDELAIPFDSKKGFRRAAGEPFPPSEPAWTYSDPKGFYSAFISGAQRLPNGNTLVCSGAPGRLFEVTPQGRIVWDYRNPHGGEIEPPEHAGRAPPRALFRGTRLGREHPGVRNLLQ